jgi:hypothetical protein
MSVKTMGLDKPEMPINWQQAELFSYFYILYFRFLQKYIFDLEIYRKQGGQVLQQPGSGAALMN